MNNSFVAAAALAFATGLAHTVIGELLIFRRMRRGTVVPTFGGNVLGERHFRILWACWHALTFLGWSMAAMLLLLATAPAGQATRAIAHLIAWGMTASAGIVLVGTRGRHPGWLAMALVAGLVEYGL